MAGLKILAVHGTGRQETPAQWFTPWLNTIRGEVQRLAPGFDEPDLQIEPLIYQPIYQPFFAAGRPNMGDYAKGFALFAGSLIQHSLFGPSRGLFELPEEVRWGVGMVVLWGEEDDLRA